MKVNDFLKTEMLGNKFVAIKGYSEVKDKAGKHSAFRLNVSIQDESSQFFMELIPVKVKTLTPKLGFNEMESNKITPVILENLQVGQFEGNLWFSCTDVFPAK